MKKPLRLGVLASGNGSNLQAIIDACEQDDLKAQVAVVISDQEDAFALTRAKKHKIANFFVDRTTCQGSADFNRRIRAILKMNEVELVVMAGYMKLLGSEVLKAFPNRVMNIHPALLPSFPGGHGIQDALDYGVKVTGVTVHFADEEFDTGPIILQGAVDVREGDTEDSIAQRIHQLEHRLYPEAIRLFSEGRLKIQGRKVSILPATPGA